MGVEHLLRDIRNITVGSLSQQLTNQLNGLKGFYSSLNDIKSYMDKVIKVGYSIGLVCHTLACGSLGSMLDTPTQQIRNTAMEILPR